MLLVITDGKADDPKVLEEEADLLTTEDIIVRFNRLIYLSLFFILNMLSTNYQYLKYYSFRKKSEFYILKTFCNFFVWLYCVLFTVFQ